MSGALAARFSAGFVLAAVAVGTVAITITIAIAIVIMRVSFTVAAAAATAVAAAFLVALEVVEAVAAVTIIDVYMHQRLSQYHLSRSIPSCRL